MNQFTEADLDGNLERTMDHVVATCAPIIITH
jgi:hypothetical protein